MRPLRIIAIFAAALLLANCSALPSWMGGGPSISRISIVSEPGANANVPIGFDLVMTSDPDAAAALMKLTANEWFVPKDNDQLAARDRFERDYPDSLVIWHRELAAGQILRDAPIDSPSGMVCAVVFALYASDGEHRLRLGPSSNVHLTLDTDDVRLSQ